MRYQNRKPDELRPLHIKTDVNKWSEGSVEISMGDTVLICSSSVIENVPKWLHTPKQGWVTAEYGMLPRSGHARISREKSFSGGRSQEISRLIGRSLRSCIDLKKLGERTIQIDCDVLQADGGTRTAAITGSFIALSLAIKHLKDQVLIPEFCIKHYVAAISVGLLKTKPMLDLDFKEDSQCETDMNFVMNDENHFIEIQGTAEKSHFSKDQLNSMIEFATKGCRQLFKEQEKHVGNILKTKSP